MTDTDTAAPVEDDDALRKRLLSRIAVAGVAIVGLLGGLAVFDSLNRPQAPAMPPMAALPTEPPPALEDKKANEEQAVVKEEKVDEKPAEVATTEAVPEKSEPAPVSEPVIEAPIKSAKPLTTPATAKPATMKPSESPVAKTRPEAQQELAQTVPEETSPPQGRRQTQSSQVSRHAPASRPLTRAAEATRRFLVQVGVFSNHANAEELVTKLQEAGIPAQIESHVQVGPFASRMEADAARAKLRAMGIDESLLVRR